MEIIKFQSKLESIIANNNDLIGKESQNLVAEYAIQTARDTKDALAKIEDENRLLQIGIIGRVKAGKSSLLNAMLFDGQAILPKAATPMTAALTIISYGETLSANVDFFTKNDIENIRKEHARYKRELRSLVQQKSIELKVKAEKKKKKESKFLEMAKPLSDEEIAEINEKADRQAKRELKDNISLISAYDQFNRMENSGIDFTCLAENELLSANSLDELSVQLLDYVGSDGRYMPFTKSVHIKIPQENLKNIQIIDTPGVNDPVLSREERTRDLLKFCDVVLIVSPAGQFLSKEDVDLMDRITTKEGIRELYVIASQVDLQLFGSVKEDSCGDLNKAFDSITKDLAGHLYSTLTTLKQNNPEVGDTYDQLIEQSRTKVIYSSGICHTIRSGFEHKSSWDEGTKKAWENLTINYPDHFSDTNISLSLASLDLLSNISTIDSIVSDVKLKKTEILERRKSEFVNAKMVSLQNYSKALLNHISEQVHYINNGDIEDLIQQKKSLSKIKDNVSVIIDEEYQDLINDFKIGINEKLISKLKDYFKEAGKSIKDAESSETESYEVSSSSWYNPFSWGSSETRHRTHVTVRTGAIKNALDNFTSEIEDSIETTSLKLTQEWKKSIYKSLISLLRDNAGDDNLEPEQIKRVLRNVLNSVVYPDINYTGHLPDSLSATGTLMGSSAEKFIDDAQTHASSLRERVKRDIKSYLSNLTTALSALCISEDIFKNYNVILDTLEEQINNKAITLDKFERLEKELNKAK